MAGDYAERRILAMQENIVFRTLHPEISTLKILLRPLWFVVAWTRQFGFELVYRLDFRLIGPEH